MVVGVSGTDGVNCQINVETIGQQIESGLLDADVCLNADQQHFCRDRRRLQVSPCG